MKRTRIMGLCVMAAMAAFAMSAIAASSASAGTYYTCSATKKGEYTNSTCTAKSAKAHKGKYELAPVATCVAQKKGEYENSACTTKSAKAHKGKYEKAKGLAIKSATGEAKLETPELGGTVICKASTGVGAFTGAKTNTLQVTFTGCSTKGVACESAGQASGTIETYPLEGTLIDSPEKGLGGKSGPIAGEVWIDLKGTAADAGVQAVFGCEGIGYFKTTGTLAGVVTPVNTPGLTGKEVFSNGLGEQALETEVSSNPTFPPAESLGPFHSTEVTEGTTTYEKDVDVKS